LLDPAGRVAPVSMVAEPVREHGGSAVQPPGPGIDDIYPGRRVLVLCAQGGPALATAKGRERPAPHRGAASNPRHFDPAAGGPAGAGGGSPGSGGAAVHRGAVPVPRDAASGAWSQCSIEKTCREHAPCHWVKWPGAV